VIRFTINWGLRLIAIMIGLSSLAVPAVAYWDASQPPVPGVYPQQQVAIPPTSGTMAAAYPGVLVLCYHDISETPHNRYMVTPKAFASQMATLVAEGYHAISISTFHRWRMGVAALPTRPVMITFDDGPKSTWIYADHIFQKLGLHGSVFLITGDVSHHQPYYLDWAEIKKMSASGRWDFGSHTKDGHGVVPIDQIGLNQGAFLTQRAWLAGQQRLETLDEYRARVQSDLDGSISDIVSHGLPRPTGFAYPFSAFNVPTNDVAVPPLLREMVAARFPDQFDNAPAPQLVQRDMTGPLPRVEVFSSMGDDGLDAALDQAISQVPTRQGS
jgi:poly-beta-1,6-N-acetyl-D-glucosamine N-deacetylase